MVYLFQRQQCQRHFDSAGGVEIASAVHIVPVGDEHGLALLVAINLSVNDLNLEIIRATQHRRGERVLCQALKNSCERVGFSGEIFTGRASGDDV